MKYRTIDALYAAVKKRLAAPRYQTKYANEDEFEEAVWHRLFKMFGPERERAAKICLTSHTKRKGRSPAEWKAFIAQDAGADVSALGSKNRLDIVVRHRRRTIGIEVKRLGSAGHTAKLTQGGGQAILALAHRNRTLVMIHCGTRPAAERKALRKIAEKITSGSGTAIIVVP